jgi:pimeloyl-ACP methyl ester carboxylesterase
MLATSLAIVAGILTTVFGALWLRSAGQIRPAMGADGKPLSTEITEKLFVQINGARQGMIIRSANPLNPVLLFVHGGPAMPTYCLDRHYPTGLEADFTMVWWDQRGAGLSYRSDIPAKTMSVQQIVDDTVAVADYLRARFGKEKIYLMGHSWGSFIGIQAAAKAPERFHAYIGVGQVTHQLTSERLAYEYMLQAYRSRGDRTMVRKLEASGFAMMVPLPNAYMAIRDSATHALGVGTTRKMRSVISGLFLPSWLSPEYTLHEKLNIWRGKWSPHSTRLWNDVLRSDIRTLVPKLAVPVHFFHGRHDYTVSFELANTYLEHMEAPLKRFHVFEGSAHSPIFEEPERARAILREEVLRS